jgi:hypothetical protein
MRRLRSVVAVSVVVAGLCGPAPAGAQVSDAYQRVAEKRLSFAPLVPTTVPRSLRPIDRTVSLGSTRGGRGYSLRLVRNGPEAVLVVTGGEFKRLRAVLRDGRRGGFRARRTRVRGHRGYLLTRRGRPVARELAWVERGVVYTVGSGTPRTVSLGELRSAARDLDRLERDWIGASSDPDNSSEAFGVTTEHTVTVNVSFEASCTVPGSPEPTVRVGQAAVTLLRRQGDRFAFDIAEHRADEAPWTGTVTGTIAPTAITLEIRASGTIDGLACDTGTLTLRLDRHLS